MSKILIVDDDEMLLMMARHVLSRKYDVSTATTAEEAIEVFDSEQPDMILSDLMMPGIDGYELHRLLQEQSSRPVPIMFMTADDSEETESKSFELGAADYIHKPFKPDILLRRVGNIIDNLDKIHGLETAASTDPLTKLLNKSAAQRDIGELVKKYDGALLMIDLDSFKLVNDIYGHATGDKVLIVFAELIRRVIRKSDLAGRMGGDEFIAFLHSVDDEKILRDKTIFLNEQLLTAAKKLLGSDMQIPLGTSIGAVFVPDEGTDFAALYKKADAALYNVKRNGKHGLEVFGAHNRTAKHSAAGISQTRLILSERNEKSGAYFVEFETFRKIYRLMVRMSNKNKNLMLMQFTLATDDFAAEFKEILVNSLRRSDCVTQNGKKFLILLTITNESDVEIVRDRIFSRLDKNFTDKILFEREKIF